MTLAEKIEQEGLADKFKNEVIDGDIAIMHDMNWDFSERLGEPYKAIILWRGTNNQPLCLHIDKLNKGIYRPVWESYTSIIEIVGHIDLAELFKQTKEVTGKRIIERLKKEFEEGD